MISALRGTVLSVRSGVAVVDVQGVGYAVHVTDDHGRSLHSGDVVTVHTALVVREDSLTLFGFANTESVELFTTLLSVNGVGPRSALAILSTLSPADVLTAVVTEDDAPFRKVSGIGPKTAKLIVVQLAGKLTALGIDSSAPAASASIGRDHPVVQALIGLGWTESQAVGALSEVKATPGSDAAEQLRLALAYLSGSR